MSIPTYTLGYPPDGASLGQTKSTIRNNLDGTFETLAVDHVNNNGGTASQPAGYHTIIHEVPQTSVNTVTGYNQVFSGVPGTLVVNSTTTSSIPSNSDQQLYSLTGAGVLSQLTGHSASSNGYQWLGGTLFQWGMQAIGSGSSVTGRVDFSSFNVNFPNNCFAISLTLISKTGGTSSSDDTLCVTGSTVSATGFNWIFNGNSGSFTNFYWTAIGN